MSVPRDVQLVRESMRPGSVVTAEHAAACERLRGTDEMAALLREQRHHLPRPTPARHVDRDDPEPCRRVGGLALDAWDMPTAADLR